MLTHYLKINSNLTIQDNLPRCGVKLPQNLILLLVRLGINVNIITVLEIRK